MVTKKALLELGNRYLWINSRARKLQKEFEKLLLEHCGLDRMPGDCSDVYIDLDYAGASGMTEKDIDKIVGLRGERKPPVSTVGIANPLE